MFLSFYFVLNNFFLKPPSFIIRVGIAFVGPVENLFVTCNLTLKDSVELLPHLKSFFSPFSYLQFCFDLCLLLKQKHLNSTAPCVEKCKLKFWLAFLYQAVEGNVCLLLAGVPHGCSFIMKLSLLTSS